MNRYKLTAAGLAVLLVLSGCGRTQGSVSSGDTSDTVDSGTQTMADTQTDTSENTSASDSEMFTDRDYEVGYDESACAKIILSGDSASSDSDAVKISGSTVTITDEGSYIISGQLSDGMIVVEAEDTDKVALILDGVDITSASSAAIYVKTADKVFVTTAKDSENKLSNGGTYENIDDNNIDGVIFSKSDLTLNGQGTLEITGSAGHGIVSKDDLAVTSGTYTVTAGKQALSGKDSIRISGGEFTLNAGTDGLHSENTEDADKGFIYISGGTLNMTAGDDGIHASDNVAVLGGEITIAESYEGIEGLTIDISGGNITVTSSDDGLNAAGGNDDSGFTNPNGMGGSPDSFDSDSDAYIHISGGTMNVNASGDGIDSNGSLIVSGGETYVSGPEDGGNGTLDYGTTAEISGGIFAAAGSSAMAQNFGSDSSQGVMLVSTGSQQAGTAVMLSDADGSQLLSWTPAKSYECVIISCPEITEGSSYTVTAGDDEISVTMDSLVYGTSGMGGMGGNPGSMDGRGPGGAMDGQAPNGGMGSLPPDKGGFSNGEAMDNSDSGV